MVRIHCGAPPDPGRRLPAGLPEALRVGDASGRLRLPGALAAPNREHGPGGRAPVRDPPRREVRAQHGGVRRSASASEGIIERTARRTRGRARIRIPCANLSGSVRRVEHVVLHRLHGRVGRRARRVAPATRACRGSSTSCGTGDKGVSGVEHVVRHRLHGIAVVVARRDRPSARSRSRAGTMDAESCVRGCGRGASCVSTCAQDERGARAMVTVHDLERRATHRLHAPRRTRAPAALGGAGEPQRASRPSSRPARRITTG